VKVFKHAMPKLVLLAEDESTVEEAMTFVVHAMNDLTKGWRHSPLSTSLADVPRRRPIRWRWSTVEVDFSANRGDCGRRRPFYMLNLKTDVNVPFWQKAEYSAAGTPVTDVTTGGAASANNSSPT
jgi:hypothetical protein